MQNDINNFDTEDIGLKQIFGERFQDMSAESGAQQIKKQETTYTSESVKAEQSGAHKRTYKDAKWEPLGELPKSAPNWLDKLKSCAKGIGLFAGLSVLLFYWQQTGQMETSAAFPSMCVCFALAGFSVGKVVAGGKR